MNEIIKVAPVRAPQSPVTRPPGLRGAEISGYVLIAPDQDDGFDPFDPDALGALREAYTWITQPQGGTPGRLSYDSRAYYRLTVMLRHAIAKLEGRAP